MIRHAPRIAAVTIALLIGHPAMALEEPRYDVVGKTDVYEVRRYAPYLVAEVDVRGRSADSQGFRTLAGYIFGDNDSSEKMRMTAPVESRDGETGDATTYGFVMERQYTLETLPTPNDERIQIREKPARTVAVLRFSGRWSDKNLLRRERELLNALKTDGIEARGAVELARYNSPFTPWFMRRNELMVPIEWPSGAP